MNIDRQRWQEKSKILAIRRDNDRVVKRIITLAVRLSNQIANGRAIKRHIELVQGVLEKRMQGRALLCVFENKAS